jgi:dTDP-4-dehydro-2,3,6-trideoxy-D-glucose 4-aminotransferase
LFHTAALLDLQAGDEAVLPSISFLAAAQAICAAGTTPVFCDVDPHSLKARLQDIEVCIAHRTRAVVFLPYGGILAAGRTRRPADSS